MQKIILVAALLLAANAQAQAQAQDKASIVNEGISTDQLTHRAPIHWVSISQIQHSLKGKPPMTVGFDVDDTVLFSSPCFFYGKQKYSPNDASFLKNPQFWTDINANCDKNYSLPKQVAAKLIALHEQRGDTIYFITGRPNTPGEQLTATIKRDFHMEKTNPVIFTASDNAKTAFLKSHHIKIYYGDSDGDMTQAIAAGARPIRILRAANTTYKPMPKNGKYGEEVVIDSDY